MKATNKSRDTYHDSLPDELVVQLGPRLQQSHLIQHDVQVLYGDLLCCICRSSCCAACSQSPAIEGLLHPLPLLVDAALLPELGHYLVRLPVALRLQQRHHPQQPPRAVVGLDDGLVDLDGARDALEEQRQRVGEDDVRARRVRLRRRADRLLQVRGRRVGHLRAEVAGEAGEALVVHVDEREDLEEALDGGVVLAPHRLVEPPHHDVAHLDLGPVQRGQRRVEAAGAAGREGRRAVLHLGGRQLEEALVHGQEAVEVGGGLLVVLLGEGGLDAVAAEVQVDEVFDAVLAVADAALKRRDLTPLRRIDGTTRFAPLPDPAV